MQTEVSRWLSVLKTFHQGWDSIQTKFRKQGHTNSSTQQETSSQAEPFFTKVHRTKIHQLLHWTLADCFNRRHTLDILGSSGAENVCGMRPLPLFLQFWERRPYRCVQVHESCLAAGGSY